MALAQAPMSTNAIGALWILCGQWVKWNAIMRRPHRAACTRNRGGVAGAGVAIRYWNCAHNARAQWFLCVCVLFIFCSNTLTLSVWPCGRLAWQSMETRDPPTEHPLKWKRKFMASAMQLHAACIRYNPVLFIFYFFPIFYRPSYWPKCNDATKFSNIISKYSTRARNILPDGRW